MLQASSYGSNPLSPMANAKHLRPSPTTSATRFPPNTYARGNDGRFYVTTLIASNNVQRWVPVNSNDPSLIDMLHMLGNYGKVVKSGSGFPDVHVNEWYKLIAYNPKGYFNGRGFHIENPPARCNQSNVPHMPFVGTDSFDLKQLKTEDQLIREGYIHNTSNPDSLKSETIQKHIDNLKQKTMSKANKTTQVSMAPQPQEIRTIETSLINKDEVFRMLALAESTGLPCLLVGDPGVAKTKTVIEYAKAWLNKDGKMTAQDFMSRLYVLETDEGTKASEIKGMPDLSKLFTENKYEVLAPIADADIVVINEVDKASSAIRNAMLGVMNEKFLFNGKHKIPCKWRLFIATCNEIPKEEADSPFWDRFMLKMKVNRVSAGEMSKYYQSGARSYQERIKVPIPTMAEIDAVNIPVKKLEKYLEVGYQECSDRTLTFVPRLARAVSHIWNISVDKALVKTAEIMIGQAAGSTLQNKLMSAEVKAIMSKVDMLRSQTTNEQLELAIAEIEGLINTYTSRGILDEDQVTEIETTMNFILSSHPAYNPNEGEQFEEALSASNF